jgi:LuxR family maltose regulon positive regulatory protein
MSLLDRLQQAAEAGGRMGSVIEIGVLQALGNLALALIALERALRLAEPEGYVRIFVDKIFDDEGLPMMHLLSTAAAQGILADYSGKLLAVYARSAAFGTAAEGDLADPSRTGIATVEAEAQPYIGGTRDKAAVPSASPAQPVIAQRAHSAIAQRAFAIEPLSARELQILQLIVQGLSNGEICARLFLALSTVKGYNRIIFDKLQVQRRTEAVARARELGLL